MQARIYTIGTVILVTAAVTLGCQTRTAPPAGSLERESQAREGTFKQEWAASGANLSRFRKIQLRDLDISNVKQKESAFPKFEFENLNSKDSPKLQRVFRAEFEKTLREAGYSIVSPRASAGPDTLVMAPRLLEVETPVIWLNTLTTLLVGPVTSGGATFEADFFDGSKVAAAEIGETQSGAWHFGSVVLGGYQKTYSAEIVFRQWAVRTVEFLKEN